MKHNGYINRRAVKARFAEAGYRTSAKDLLDKMDAIVESWIRAGIRGMPGNGRKTVYWEDVEKGRIRG